MPFEPILFWDLIPSPARKNAKIFINHQRLKLAY